MIYLIATPIGNLKDITLRALETLKNVDLIACEDTRTSKVLLDHYHIDKKLVSYHKFNEETRAEKLLELAQTGKEIAVISDAGMPGISDPGNILIKKAIERSVPYTVLPGPSAFTNALVLSGFDNSSFIFMGFLPNKGSDRNRLLKDIGQEEKTIILYESPHKLDKTLRDLYDINPDRRVAVVREISKLYESVQIFKLKDYKDQEIVKKGEIVLLLESIKKLDEITDESIKKSLKELMEAGESRKSAIKIIAKEANLAKNRVYDLSLNLED